MILWNTQIFLVYQECKFFQRFMLLNKVYLLIVIAKVFPIKILTTQKPVHWWASTKLQRNLNTESKVFVTYNTAYFVSMYRSRHPEVVLEKDVLKICSKFTREHACRSVICNFIEITLQQGCSPVNLLHIYRIPFPKNTSGCLLLHVTKMCV